MSDLPALIDFATFAVRNVLIAFAILAIMGLVVLIGGCIFTIVRNITRHIWRGSLHDAVRFATSAATVAAEGEVHGRGGVVFEWLLAFLKYRDGRLRSIPTDYSETSEEFVYTTIEAGER